MHWDLTDLLDHGERFEWRNVGVDRSDLPLHSANHIKTGCGASDDRHATQRGLDVIGGFEGKINGGARLLHSQILHNVVRYADHLKYLLSGIGCAQAIVKGSRDQADKPADGVVADFDTTAHQIRDIRISVS
jgi:hypothetical protein